MCVWFEGCKYVAALVIYCWCLLLIWVLVVQVLAAAKRHPMVASFRMKPISRPKLQALDSKHCRDNGAGVHAYWR